MFKETGNAFLDRYMEMVEHTESPRVYHLWSAISSVAASLGRRNWLDFGDGKIYPNLYILLVGNAATRKSTAMNIGKGLLKRSTDVRFAPDSTAGKYQGLITAMEEDEEEEDEDIKAVNEAVMDLGATLNAVNSVKLTKTEPKKKQHIAPEDKHTLYVTASEFNTFIGHGNVELLEFLSKTFDGEDFDYTLRNTRALLEDPLLNLIGCTTPTNIATAMPHEAIGQGFTSRIVLVYGEGKYKSIPRPPPFPTELKSFLSAHIRRLYYDFAGRFDETTEAYGYANEIYERPSDLIDSRFTYYLQRRHTHFLKIGMVLAAMRGSHLIEESDYVLADNILLLTEKGMPDAFGEYGLSPTSLAKQRIVEFVRACDVPVTAHMLWSMLGRDIRTHEFTSCVRDLVSAGKIQEVKIPRTDGNGEDLAYIPYSNVTPETLEIMDALTTGPGTGTIQ